MPEGKLQKNKHQEGDRFLVKVPSLSRDSIVEITIVEWSPTGEYVKIKGLPSRDWSKASDLWIVENLPRFHEGKEEIAGADLIRKFSDADLALEIVAGIVDEFRNRKVFRIYWDDLDEEIQTDVIGCARDRVVGIFCDHISKLKPEGEI